MTWPNRNSAGFTLIEMLVVLTLVALVMAIIPSVRGGLSNAELRAAADRLVDQLRMARSAAIAQGVATEFVLDPANRLYRLSSESQVYTLPSVVQRLDAAGLSKADRLVRVRFAPDGSATAGRLLLFHGSRSASITIDWLTGNVRRDG